MIILVDLSALFSRHYFASGSGPFAYELTLTDIIGCIETGARVIVCCEGGNLLRAEWDPSYKAQRPEKPADMIRSLRETIQELKQWEMIAVVACRGFEADDVISSIVNSTTDEVRVLSQDKDLWALLSDRVSLIIDKKLITPADCFTKFGVHPHQIRDYLAICGDSADNIKGCPGIGSKGAARLLQQFGTLDAIRAASDDELGLGKKTLAKFRAWDPTMALRLTTLLNNAPLDIEQLLGKDDMADMSKIVMERGKGPLRILAYGPEGVGKTRFGAFSPKPIFLQPENGLSAPDLKSVPAFPAPDGWADVLGAIDYLKTSQHEYKTLVIDSLDWLHQYARAEVCKRENMSPSQYEDYGRGEKHTFELWVALISALNDLQSTKGMHVIALAHSGMEVYQNPQGEDFVRYQLALSKKAAEKWKQWPDFLLFMSQEIFSKKAGGDKAAKGFMAGRKIYTEKTAAFDAKNRMNLPAEIEYETANPWGAFAAAVRETTQANTPQAKQETAA